MKKSTRKKAEPKGNSEKCSGLDAAARVLAKSNEPLKAKDLTAKVLELGLWKTQGKTPHATLNAAIHREIKSKGNASRFKKAGKGLFALAS